MKTRYKITFIHGFLECDTEEEDHQGMKEWLKNHTEPTTKVKKFMEKTVINRAKWIRENKDLPIQSVITEYPRLFDTPGMVSFGWNIVYVLFYIMSITKTFELFKTTIFNDFNIFNDFDDF